MLMHFLAQFISDQLGQGRLMTFYGIHSICSLEQFFPIQASQR